MCDGPQHTLHRARTMLLMRKLDGPLVANGAAQVVGTVASQWRQQRSGAALDESIRSLPVMSILAALGFAPHCFTAMLACTDAWVAGLSPLATDAQRAAAIAAMDDLLVLLAENGINSLDDSAAQVAVLMQPHEATAGLIGAGLLRLAADQGLQKAAVAGTLDCGQFGTEVLRHDPPIQTREGSWLLRRHLMGSKFVRVKLFCWF